MDRKDFFKKIAHSIGDTVAEKIDKIQEKFENEPELNMNQKVFLQEYSTWLAEFQYFVKKRNENAFDIENNKKLMALSTQAEQHKAELELLMKDPVFYHHFNSIIQEVSDAIS